MYINTHDERGRRVRWQPTRPPPSVSRAPVNNFPLEKLWREKFPLRLFNFRKWNRPPRHRRDNVNYSIRSIPHDTNLHPRVSFTREWNSNIRREGMMFCALGNLSAAVLRHLSSRGRKFRAASFLAAIKQTLRGNEEKSATLEEEEAAAVCNINVVK